MSTDRKPFAETSRKAEILDALHRRIVSGEWQPSFRLPTRRDLALEYNASSATVNEVLGSLTRDSFIRSRGKLGTFVSSTPPHLSKYAAVFPMLPNAKEYNNFHQALSREAASYKVGGRTVATLYGVNPRDDNEDFQYLCRAAQRHLVAGFIFAAPPIELADTPIMAEPGVPRVAVSVTSVLKEPFTDMATVRLLSIVDKALGYLASRGRKRVTVLHGGFEQHHDEWLEGLHRHGLCTKQIRLQAMPSEYSRYARNLISVVASRDQLDPPDALVIADDNLVQDATAGLIDAGVRVPDDMEVVAHCNFPWPTPSHLAVTRVGYDALEVLAAAVASIDAQRSGEGKINLQVEAKFEDQIRSRQG